MRPSVTPLSDASIHFTADWRRHLPVVGGTLNRLADGDAGLIDVMVETNEYLALVSSANAIGGEADTHWPPPE